MRVGVLGGTFDPIHIAHLIIAEETRAALELDRVFFIPASVPPHKRDKTISVVEHRVRMVEMAIVSNPHFVLSRLDIDRCEPCYSVNTIERLREELGPDADIHFIVGMDSLADLPTWHEPHRLVALCRLAVVDRPGFQADLGELDAVLPGVASRITFIGAPAMAISSTDIRRRVRLGLPIRYQVPDSVEQYVRSQNLYRDDQDVP